MPGKRLIFYFDRVNIVIRNNIVWKLARGYCLCYCKTFSLVPDSTECTKILLRKSAVHYLYHLKSNNIIGQRKTTNTEKHLYLWLISFNLKLSYTHLILVNCKDLLQILYIYCTNWLRVISCQEQINRLFAGCNTSRKHTRISIFKIPKAKSGMPEHKIEKKNI